MRLKGKRVLLLVEDLYQELEVWYPLLRLREEGAEVVTVAPQGRTTYRSKLGYPVDADTAAAEVSLPMFAGVIVPGGYAPDLMRRHPAMVALVRNCFLLGKTVAAICHGGWMLASAGILQGRTVTGFFAIKDDLVHAGARFVDEEVVVDGTLITSRKPEDLPAFMRAFIDSVAT
jgi:protease I